MGAVLGSHLFIFGNTIFTTIAATKTVVLKEKKKSFNYAETDSLCPFLVRKSFPLASGKWLSSFLNVGGYCRNCIK